MHNSRAGKVVKHIAKRTHHETIHGIIAQPAAAPSPMTFNGVDEQRDGSAIKKIHRELSALSHCTAYDGGRCSTKDSLKNKETLNRQIAFIETQVTPVRHADETCTVAAEHKSKTNEEEQQRAKHEVNEVLHQDVCRVLASSEASLTKGKTWLHPENQHGCQ